METATSVISICPSTKDEAERFALKLISEVESGNTNPLDLHVKLTAMEKSIKEVKEKIRPLTLKEAEKFGTKTFDAYSSEITIKETGVKYSFENCNDDEWNELNSAEERLAKKRTIREKFLKLLDKPMEIVIEGTGEIAKIYPPVKTSTTNVSVTLK